MPLSLEEPGADDYDNETFPSTLVSIIITYSFSFFYYLDFYITRWSNKHGFIENSSYKRKSKFLCNSIN